MKNADVLDRLIAGESVEASPEVRELARLATLLQGAWQDAPSRQATIRTRNSALAAFEADGAAVVTAPLAVARPSRGRRLATRLALVAALVLGLPVTAFAASADSLPGQLLYPVKRGFEELRLALAGDPLDEGRVLLDMAGKRVEEALLSNALGLGAGEALSGYEEALARFNGRIVEAQALGLPVADLTSQAQAAFATYQEMLESVFGPPPAEASASEGTPVPPTVQPTTDEPTKEKAGHQGKKKAGGKKKHRGNRNGGAAVSQSDEGDGGGQSGGGDDDDKADNEDKDDQGANEQGDAQGKGLGHEKAIGKGHQMDNGEGHKDD
ncbi:MAG: DUF5667 domain-containing protein [Actinomycetota bacterium]